MTLITPVLVRGINNLSDARYCAGMGADYLTFRLDPALPHHLLPEAVQELSGWIAGVKLVGEFDTLPAEQINAIAAACKLDYVLLHRRRTPQELALLRVPALKLVKWVSDMLAPDVEKRFRDQHQHLAGFLMTSPPYPLTTTQRAELTQQARTYRLWLTPDYAAPTSLRQLVHEVQPAGLVLEGGQEIKPGLRDFTELEAIFEELED